MMCLCDDWGRVDLPGAALRTVRAGQDPGIEKRKQTTRVDIQFLDGDKTNLCDNVPGIRLPGPWSDVVHYDELMANWQRLDQSSLDEAEEWAVEEVFLLLIPGDVATYCGSRVKDGTTVRDREALEQLMRCSLNALLEQVEWFEHDDVIELSADGTLIVAEYACRANPVPVLDKVMASEVEAREHCKRGKTYKSHDGEERTTTPEREYEWYRQRLRPYHELLRQWCGDTGRLRSMNALLPPKPKSGD